MKVSVAAVLCLFIYQVLNGPSAIDFLAGRGVSVEKTDGGEIVTKIRSLSKPLMDRDLSALIEFRELEHVVIVDAKITDRSLGVFSDLKKLKILDLRLNSGITGQGLNHLKKCPRLTSLILCKCPITNDGMKGLSGHTSLEALHLADTSITDDALKTIGTIKSLKYLGLDRTKITSAGVKHLVALGALESLSLENTKIGDEALITISRLGKLSYLNLADTAITDKAIFQIAKLKDLAYLDVQRTKISADGKNVLKKLFGKDGIVD